MYTGDDLRLQRVLQVGPSGKVLGEFAMEVNAKGHLISRDWVIRSDKWIPIDAHELWWDTRTDALYDLAGEFDPNLRPD